MADRFPPRPDDPGPKEPGLRVFGGMAAFAIFVIALIYFTRAPTAPPAPEDRNIASAKAAIRYAAKDPDSVTFRAVETKESGAVCGEFNAKNSYGAMAGFTRFIWQAPDKLSVADGGDPFEHAWNRVCLLLDY